MKLDVDFDPVLFRKGYLLNFDALWLVKAKLNNWVIVWSSIMILMGAITAYTGNTVGYLIVGISLILLISSVRFLLQYLSLKKRYAQGIEKEIEAYTQPGRKPIVWAFNADSFSYRDHKMELTYTYSALQGHRVVQDVIFIDVSKERYISYSLSKKQLGEANFTKIAELLSKKIP
ncbi:hypothetical protein [Spongiimicrobium sp. 2-473A-2-J]|uniref:hypothetical protein n=1 Tax=Eudoraea algarum TaxID=3417568 RepID=UPI003D36D17A